MSSLLLSKDGIPGRKSVILYSNPRDTAAITVVPSEQALKPISVKELP